MLPRREIAKKQIEYKLELTVIGSLFDGAEQSLGPDVSYLKRNWEGIKEELDTQSHLINCMVEKGWRAKQMMPLQVEGRGDVVCLILYEREKE